MPVRDADDDARAVASAVKADAEAKAGKSFDMFEAVQYRTQVVAGINYYIKVSICCALPSWVWMYLDLKLVYNQQG